MSEEQVTDLERDLAALLAIEPSPGLAATVRARVASSRPSSRRALWALAAAAVILAGGGVMLMRSEGRSARDLAPPPIVATTTPAVSVPSQPGETRSPARQARTRVVPAVSRKNADPQVLIDPAFSFAIRRLLRGAEQRSAEMTPVTAVAEANAPMPDLAVAPMTIDELPVGVIKVSEPQTGARQ